jgi:hypothetical protein
MPRRCYELDETGHGVLRCIYPLAHTMETSSRIGLADSPSHRALKIGSQATQLGLGG